VCLSLPTIVDLDGVERIIRLDLNDEEIVGLQKSAGVLKNIISELKI